LLPDSANVGVSKLLAWISEYDPRGALLWKLAENVTGYKSVYTHDYIVLGLV